jgi:hypothetical protein
VKQFERAAGSSESRIPEDGEVVQKKTAPDRWSKRESGGEDEEEGLAGCYAL